MSSPPAGPQPGATFGEKLNLLFDTVRPDPADERRKHRRKSAFSDVELADYIRSRIGKAVSKMQVGKWRKDEAEPPSLDVAEAIAEFFGVTPLYFFDGEKSVELMEQLRWLPQLAELKEMLDRGEVTVLLREDSSRDPRELSQLLSVVQVWRRAPDQAAGGDPAPSADGETQ